MIIFDSLSLGSLFWLVFPPPFPVLVHLAVLLSFPFSLSLYKGMCHHNVVKLLYLKKMNQTREYYSKITYCAVLLFVRLPSTEKTGDAKGLTDWQKPTCYYTKGPRWRCCITSETAKFKLKNLKATETFLFFLFLHCPLLTAYSFMSRSLNILLPGRKRNKILSVGVQNRIPYVWRGEARVQWCFKNVLRTSCRWNPQGSFHIYLPMFPSAEGEVLRGCSSSMLKGCPPRRHISNFRSHEAWSECHFW